MLAMAGREETVAFAEEMGVMAEMAQMAVVGATEEMAVFAAATGEMVAMADKNERESFF